MTKTNSTACVLSLCLLMLLSAVLPLRLHVVANSDSAVDQAIKLQVRDSILTEIGAEQSRSDAIKTVWQRGDALQNAAETALAEAGAAYGARLYLGWEDFPQKSYGGAVYPAGTYPALRVVLGEGSGQNWWCVIYPPLCLGDAAGEKVRFKSIFMEIWEKLFSKQEEV